MQAMILSAGLGTRMRPLTQHVPKPLVEVNGVPLIVYHLTRLQACGIVHIVINLGYLGEMIRDYLGNGARFGVHIHYTEEDPQALLGAGGGVKQALQLGYLQDAPLLLCSADAWTDSPLLPLITDVPPHGQRLWVTHAPAQADGDFAFADAGCLVDTPGRNRLTFSGIGVFSPHDFVAIDAEGQRIHIPVGGVACLMLEPGARISHAAIALAAQVGTLVTWVGEGGVRLYSAGQPGGARADRLLWQEKIALDDGARLKVVRKMYALRFGEDAPARRSLDQLRGIEGQRVRHAYLFLAQQHGVDWKQRKYDPGDWDKADIPNRPPNRNQPRTSLRPEPGWNQTRNSSVQSRTRHNPAGQTLPKQLLGRVFRPQSAETNVVARSKTPRPKAPLIPFF